MFAAGKISLPLFALALAFFLFTGGITAVHAQDDTPTADTAVALFNQGQDAHEKGDLKKAVELYEGALKILPEFPEAEYQRGMALASLGRSTDAESAFRKAVELREDWTLAITALGSILAREEKFEEAEKLLTKATALDPSNAAAYVALADLRLQTGASADVLKSLLERLQGFSAKANPTPAVWTARSKVEAALGDLRLAKISVESALAIDPKNRDALFQKAELAIKANEVEMAEGIANGIERAGSDPDGVALLRARIAMRAGRDDDAAGFLAKIRQTNKETERLRTVVEANRSRTPAELESIVKNDPKNAVVLGKLCSIYRVSDPSKALDYCMRASEAEPTNITPALGYAAALVQAKRYDEAVGILSKIVGLAPDSFSAHANLATALFQQKQYKLAKSEYQWLLSRQPDLTIAYFFLAICHDQLGEYLDAMANYQQFLKTADPEKNRIEIEKVNLRLPAVQKLIKNSKGGGNGH